MTLQLVSTNQVTLRDYQQRAYGSLFEKIKQGEKRIMINAPCSWGKTAFTSQIIRHFTQDLKLKVLFVVPALSLIEQAQRDFKQAGLTCGIIAGGHKFENWRTQIGSIQTLTRRVTLKWKPDVIILDECHQTAFSGWVKREIPLLLNGHEILSNEQLKMYFDTLDLPIDASLKDVQSQWNHIKSDVDVTRKEAYQYIKKYFLEKEKKPNQRLIIGLTATPWRLKKTESMADIFSSQIKCETPKEMIEMGSLVGCVYYRIKSADLSKVKTDSSGEYRQEDLGIVCSDPEVVKDAVKNYKAICPDRKFICFAVNLSHAQLLVDEFNNQGIKTVLISGDMSDNERQPLFKQMRDLSNPLMGLVSVGCISVGFSVNEIGCIIHCRPTKSASLFIQGIGRGQRLAQGKENCIVLDQAHNTKRFGFIEDVAYPDLDKCNQFELKETPSKECPDCGLIQPIFNQVCTGCGAEFELGGESKKEKVKPTGKLEVVVPERYKHIQKRYHLNLAIAYQRDYDPGWASVQTHTETGKFPHKEWGYGAIFGLGVKGVDSPVNQLRYWNHLIQLAKQLEEKQQEKLRQGIILKRVKVFDGNWMQSCFKTIFGTEYSPVKLNNRPNNTLLDLISF